MTDTIQKQTRRDDYALLGRHKNGRKTYIQRASYDCNHYFSFGYLETFQKNSSTIDAHEHWDSKFTGKKHVEPNDVKKEFEAVTLDKKELWKLCDLYKTFYTLKEAANIYHMGNSHLTGQTHGMLKDKSSMQVIQKNNTQVIRTIQDLIGMDRPDHIQQYPDRLKKI